jgi:hypothetical protein
MKRLMQLYVFQSCTAMNVRDMTLIGPHNVTNNKTTITWKTENERGRRIFEKCIMFIGGRINWFRIVSRTCSQSPGNKGQLI